MRVAQKASESMEISWRTDSWRFLHGLCEEFAVLSFADLALSGNFVVAREGWRVPALFNHGLHVEGAKYLLSDDNLDR